MNHRAIFESILEGKLPASEEEAKARFKEELKNQQSDLVNNSELSPFGKLLAVLIAKPLMLIREFILNDILPNLFLKTAGGVFLEIIAYSYNTTRLPDVKARGKITFVREGTKEELAIPIGTVISTSMIAGKYYRVKTIEDATIPVGETTISVSVEAEFTGSSYNLTKEKYIVLEKQIPEIIRVYNDEDWLESEGREVESDDALRERCRLSWTRLSGWHTNDTYRMIISDCSGLDPSNIWFTQEVPEEDRGPGSADALILLDSATLAKVSIDKINKHINKDGNHGLGDDLKVKAMPEKKMDLSMKVTFKANVDPTTRKKTEADLPILIGAIFRDNQEFPEVERVAPQQTYATSRIAAAIHRNFPDVESVNFHFDDIVANLEIPVLNSLDITFLPILNEAQ